MFLKRNLLKYIDLDVNKKYSFIDIKKKIYNININQKNFKNLFPAYEDFRCE